MWQKIKKLLRTVFTNPETVGLTQIVTSTYYLGLGLLLAIASNSLVFLIIFTLPAIIWWAVNITYINHLISQSANA